jgi:hypothetical protein
MEEQQQQQQEPEEKTQRGGEAESDLCGELAAILSKPLAAYLIDEVNFSPEPQKGNVPSANCHFCIRPFLSIPQKVVRIFRMFLQTALRIKTRLMPILIM